MDVSIIIVNYYTEKLIIDCLKSVYGKTVGIEFEIIIVDNNSSPNFAEIIGNEFSYNNIKFLSLKENIGFGRANNEGFKIATGRNIFCLNPDTVLLNNAVKILSDYLDSHPECGACGGNLFDEQMQPALSFRRILPGIKWELNELSHLLIDRILYGKNHRFNYKHHPIKVGYISGADIMIPSAIVNETGGFSPDFFMYYEETDLCCRIKNLKKYIACVPGANIQHLEGGSFDTKSINYERLERSEIGRAIYYRRNCSIISQKISNFIYSLFLRSRYLLTKNDSFKYRLKKLKEL